jgi:phosphoribosyl-ATP pyrophosphohydrolase
MTDHAGDILAAIAEVLERRKQADPESSYTAGLFNKGQDAILQKVGEEAVETVLASKSGEDHQVVSETADLWFHTLVMLSYHDIGPEAVLAELQRRFGVSGVAEKRARRG